MRPPEQLLRELRDCLRHPLGHELDREMAAWMNAGFWVGCEHDRLNALINALPNEAWDRPSDVVAQLVERNRVEDAQRFVAVADALMFGTGTAVLVGALAGCDRVADAWDEAERGLRRQPDSGLLMLLAGALAERLGRPADAERLFRRALELDDPVERESAVARLIDFLDKHGRSEEARELEATYAELLDHADDDADDDEFDDEFDDEREDWSAPKVGRNDPCPCGSGRKYKKCCGGAEPSSPEPSVFDNVLWTIVDFGNSKLRSRDMERLVDQYFGDEFDDSLDGSRQQAFIEWVHFDAVWPDGLTLAERFRNQRGARLKPAERATLDSLVASCLWPYEVRELRPGTGVTLRNLLLGTDHEVADVLLSQSAVRWDVLAARVIVSEGKTVLAGGMIPFRQDQKVPLLDAVRKALRGREPDVHAMKEIGGVFQRHEIAAQRAPLPHLVTTDSEPLVLSRTRWAIADEAAALAALRGMAELRERDDGTFEWGPERSDGPILGHATLENGQLELKCSSKERLARGKDLLARNVPGLTALGFDTFTDPWQEVLARRERGIPPPERVSDPEWQETERQYLDQYYHKLLDQPVPMLNDHSPREASRDPKLRPLLVNLLHLYENHSARSPRPYDFSWMRTELGVGPDE